NVDLISASQLLTQFLFPPEKQSGFVNKLRGGAKKRLQLLRVLITNPTFVILDERSNDLDTDTFNASEEFVENYSGVLILVSHERYLLDRLTDQLFIFTDSPELKVYNGNYSDYKLEQELEEKETKERATKVEKQNTIIQKTVLKVQENVITFKEKQELKALEKEIPQLEEQIQEKSKTMNTVSDHNVLIEIAQEVENLNKQLSEKEDRWLTLLE